MSRKMNLDEVKIIDSKLFAVFNCGFYTRYPECANMEKTSISNQKQQKSLRKKSRTNNISTNLFKKYKYYQYKIQN